MRDLASCERELARLERQHDLAMSAFKFDEANALQCRIGVIEEQRRTLAAGTPPATEPPTGIVPALTRPRRRGRRRMG